MQRLRRYDSSRATKASPCLACSRETSGPAGSPPRSPPSPPPSPASSSPPPRPCPGEEPNKGIQNNHSGRWVMSCHGVGGLSLGGRGYSSIRLKAFWQPSCVAPPQPRKTGFRANEVAGYTSSKVYVQRGPCGVNRAKAHRDACPTPTYCTSSISTAACFTTPKCTRASEPQICFVSLSRLCAGRHDESQAGDTLGVFFYSTGRKNKNVPPIPR